jgi:16S rRNA (guanine(966)-N(2))-methyltransferase RsmD
MSTRKTNPGKPGAKPVRAAPRKAPGEVRIIGGLWKRTRLTVADKPGLRPTPDRVRETLFNWLGQDLTGVRCVDAFAGTGALGFEAASRGATEVLLVESDPALFRQLLAVKTRLQANQVRIDQADGIVSLKRCPAASKDLVFLDPPFEGGLFEPALRAALHVLAPAGFIYLEAPKAWGEEELAPLGLALARHGKAGMVHYHLLVRAGEKPAEG